MLIKTPSNTILLSYTITRGIEEFHRLNGMSLTLRYIVQPRF
jgi:hypothetical protein